MLPERVDIRCPEDGSAMELRNGRFGPFLASVNYPAITFVLNLDKKGNIKYPAIPPVVVEEVRCTKCESPMNLRRGKRGPWLGCSKFPKCRGRVAWTSLEEELKADLEKRLELHEAANPPPDITRQDGVIIPEGTRCPSSRYREGWPSSRFTPKRRPSSRSKKPAEFRFWPVSFASGRSAARGDGASSSRRPMRAGGGSPALYRRSMSRAARVLMIAAQDVGGSLYYLGQELRRQGKFQCRLLTLGRDERAAFPGDLDQIYDGGEELKALLAAADVLHLVDCLPEELNLFGRPLSEWIESRRRLKVALQFDGRTPIVSGKAGEARVQTAKERGWSTWSTRPGLATRLGIDFLPPFIPWWRGPWSPLAPGTRKRESLRRPGVIFASSRATAGETISAGGTGGPK